MAEPDRTIRVWRHPRPIGADGRCIGVTDLAVDPRKSRRLASRIRQVARRLGLPHRVMTSRLRRSADVGRWLRRWGWRHDMSDALGEMDFGRWDGARWTGIARDEVDAWCADFLHAPPGDGESVDALFDRVAAWRDATGGPALVVGHAGWMLAARWLAEGTPRPQAAAQWPAPPRYGACLHLPDGTRR